MKRRQFLKAGIAGSLFLASVALLHKPLDRMAKQSLVAGFPLEASMRSVMTSVVPVMLAGTLPTERAARQTAVYRAVDAVALAISALSAPAQKEVVELFALLAFPPTRIALAGVRTSWETAEIAVVDAFLARWRNSPVDLLKGAYMALHDLTFGAWYADPSTWDAIGYPGPPAVPWTHAK